MLYSSYSLVPTLTTYAPKWDNVVLALDSLHVALQCMAGYRPLYRIWLNLMSWIIGAGFSARLGLGGLWDRGNVRS